MAEKRLKDLKQNDWFTLKPVKYPNESQVYIREEYSRENKKYYVTKWEDTSHSRLMNGDKIVYTDFVF